jgi:hypothetical protein
MRNTWTVPTAHAVIREFFETGRRSARVEWEQT